jgi:hypothetical protein
VAGMIQVVECLHGTVVGVVHLQKILGLVQITPKVRFSRKRIVLN